MNDGRPIVYFFITMVILMFYWVINSHFKEIEKRENLILELEDTITDVIAAGPAKSGIAKGKIEVEIILPSIDFSFLADLLSRSISIEINNRIIPPAILKEYNEIFK